MAQQLICQGLVNDTTGRKLTALSSLYAYLCERYAVWHNSVLGVKRPRSMNRNGVTPALGDPQARMLLQPPSGDRLNEKCEEICALNVGDIQEREAVPHLCVEGKGDKVHHLPLYVLAQRLLAAL